MSIRAQGGLMKKTLISLLLIAPSLVFAKADRYYAVKTDHLNSYQQKEMVRVLKSEKGYSLVRLTPDQVMSISTHVHETEHNCGGVVDLSVDVEDKKVSIFTSFKDFLKKPNFKRYDYQINDDAKVNAALTNLSKSVYESDLRAFTSFPNRFANSELGVQASEWLRDKALAYAADYGRSNDIKVKMVNTPRYKQPSVLVKIAGSNPDLEGVLIGGHLDSYSGNKPAVDDDASGTIASLEVFRGIMASGLKFQRDIYIAFYAAEEWGLHGSKAIANDFTRKGIPLKGIMQLDMISYSAETNHHFTFVRDYTNDSLTQYTKELAMHYLKTPADKIADTRCGYGCSDHASWHRNSYPAVTPFEAAMNSMNSRLHTSDDTMMHADMDHAFRFVQLGMAFVVETADPL
jgi:leucyl aminopeptidase